MRVYVITIQGRAHKTEKACKLHSERNSLICAEWRYAAARPSAHDAEGTMVHTASCSTKACTMPVMKLICGDKRLADCYCSTKAKRLSIAGETLFNVLRSKTFQCKDLPAPAWSAESRRKVWGK